MTAKGRNKSKSEGEDEDRAQTTATGSSRFARLIAETQEGFFASLGLTVWLLSDKA